MSSVLESQLSTALVHIAQQAFPSWDMPPFHLCLKDEAPKSKYGHYVTSKREIVVFHLDRPLTQIVITALHELAHHRAELAFGPGIHHKLRFWKEYREIVEAAIQLNYLPSNGLTPIDYDMRTIARKVGTIRLKPPPDNLQPLDAGFTDKLITDKTVYLKVFNSYAIRDSLKRMGFFFQKATPPFWALKVSQNDVDTMIAGVRNLNAGAVVQVSDRL